MNAGDLQRVALVATKAAKHRRAPAQDVEDIAQAACLMALERYDATRGALGTFASRAVGWVLCDQGRRLSTAAKHEDAVSAHAGAVETPHDILERAELDDALRATIARMTPEGLALLLDERGVEHVGADLGVAGSTVWRWRERARARVRAALLEVMM